eukprot:7383663-Prymnesium_polylepis.1
MRRARPKPLQRQPPMRRARPKAKWIRRLEWAAHAHCRVPWRGGATGGWQRAAAGAARQRYSLVRWSRCKRRFLGD